MIFLLDFYQELALLWEKMRCRNIPKEDRSRLVSEALKKMKGKISEIASSHVSSRVLQSESDGGEAVEGDTNGDDENPDLNTQLNEGGKKDSFKRRQELLVNSGLAEKLVDACCEMAEDLLRSKYGKEVIYEVATGGADGILHPTLNEKLRELHEAIASIVAQPKLDEPEQEHILEHFHSSRTIRKLVLDCPAFASFLWEKALKGNCAIWSKGHSSKVVNAFLETTDSAVKELAKEEMQPLIEKGDLSLPVVDELGKRD